MNYTKALRCRECGREYPLDPIHVCEFCFGPLEVSYDYDPLACASTGNLANSVAAHAAKAGMRSLVFIPADLEQGKVIGSAIYAPTLVAVEGSYDEVNRLCSELSDKYPWAFVNINM